MAWSASASDKKRGAAMRNLALATAVLALATNGFAHAADLPTKAPIYTPAQPVPYSWTGCYVGVAGGGGWGRSRHISGEPATFGQNITNDSNVSGGIVGVEYGCNYLQSGPFVLGTESDFSWTSIRGSGSNIPPSNPLIRSGANEQWLSTTRVRAGFLANNQLLLYATGGLASGRIEATIDRTALDGLTYSEAHWRWGWTAGGGIEYALGGGWSAKADYLYVRLASQTYISPPIPPFTTRSDVPFAEHIVRIGVNYKFTDCVFFLFGCGGSVVAKY